MSGNSVTRTPGTTLSAKAVAQRAVQAVVSGDLDQVESLFATDVRLHGRSGLDRGGRAGVRQRALWFAAALWDCVVTFDSLVSAGELVVSRWSAHGARTSWLFGVAADSRRVHVAGTSIMRVRDGLVVEDWTEHSPLEPVTGMPAEVSRPPGT